MAKPNYFGLSTVMVAAVFVAVLVAYAPASARGVSGDGVPPPEVNVVDVEPDKGANGVPVTTNVQAVFDRDMDPSTLNKSTVKLRKMDSNKPSESATISYDAGTRTVTLDPERPHLHSGRTYKATIVGGEKGVRSVDGGKLAKNEVWTFKVR